MDVSPLVSQKRHGLYAVSSHVHTDGPVGVAENLLRQPDVTGAVFDQENLDRQTFSSACFHDFPSPSAKSQRKVEPWPSCDWTEMLPPCRSTIFLQMANPMPVPANSSRLCSRWNMPKIFSKYCESIPSALSCTENIHFLSPFWVAEMCT